MTNSCL